MFLFKLAGEIIPAAPELEQQRNNPTQENILSKEALDVVENSGEFYVEYAKSSRSHCISCQGKIVKNEVRISQKDYTSIRAKSLPMPCLVCNYICIVMTFYGCLYFVYNLLGPLASC